MRPKLTDEFLFVQCTMKIKGKKRNKRIITQLSEERKQEIRAKINLSHRTHHHQSYG
jgi:hypothetical protein